jgi:hypothetical protein
MATFVGTCILQGMNIHMCQQRILEIRIIKGVSSTGELSTHMMFRMHHTGRIKECRFGAKSEIIILVYWEVTIIVICSCFINPYVET